MRSLFFISPCKAALSLLPILLAFVTAGTAFGQGTGFTYQGRLTDGGTPANGIYDMQFKLYDSPTVGTGTLQGSPNTVMNLSVQVANGIFTVPLDFGSSGFPGTDRFLEIAVRLHSADPNNSSYIPLSPRQQLTSSPYAIRTILATTANQLSSSCAACVQDSQINSVAGSKVSGNVANATNATNAANANLLDNHASTEFPLLGQANVFTNTQTFQTGSATEVVVQAAPGQTAALQQWKDSAGSIVASVTAAGAFTGPLGQDVLFAAGENALAVTTATTTYTLLPGLTKTITVPTNSVLYVASTGGVTTADETNASGYSFVPVALFVDGSPFQNGGIRNIVAANTTGFTLGMPAYWTINIFLPLSAGTHTIDVRAKYGLGNAAFVSGSSGSSYQGTLNIVVIKK